MSRQRAILASAMVGVIAAGMQPITVPPRATQSEPSGPTAPSYHRTDYGGSRGVTMRCHNAIQARKRHARNKVARASRKRNRGTK